MDKHIKTKGVVLKRIDFKEADQIVTILTEDQGKVSLVAKGARRLKSRFCGRLEPFFYVELNYFKGQNLGHLNEVTLLHGLNAENLSLSSQSQLFYILEATEKLIAEAQDAREAYELLLEVSKRIQPNNINALFYAYMIKLLGSLGFMGPWDTCSQSNLKINLEDNLFLSSEDSGIRSGAYSGHSDKLLSPEVVKWVNYIQKQDLDKLTFIRASAQQQSEMFIVLKSVLSTVLNKPFKAEAFLKEFQLIY